MVAEAGEGRSGARIVLPARLRQVDIDDLVDAAGAGTEQHDALAQVHRLADIVGDEDDGHAAARPHLQQLAAQHLAGHGVERGEGLVHQQHLRLDGQRPGEADALLHAARQLVRKGIGEIAEADGAEQGKGPLAAFGLVVTAQRQRELDIPRDGAPGQEAGRLEHHGEVGARLGLPAHDGDAALFGRDQAVDDAEQSGLAAAGRADQRQELAGAKVERHVLQRADLAVAEQLADVAEGDQRLGHVVARQRPMRRSA